MKNRSIAPLQSIRGMHDLLPEAAAGWRQVEETLRRLLTAYGYGEVRTPIVEKTALFRRSIGAATDIVEKEMYAFADRNDESLALRPEGTAGCARALIEHGLLRPGQRQRVWYMGPMFRYERPQKGRSRQFHQAGAEAFGFAGPDIDAEMILMTARLWRLLGVRDVALHINSLGSARCRERYRAALTDYLAAHRAQLDDDSLRRLESNPLRILDSKNRAMEGVVAAAPRILDFLEAAERDHFDALLALLEEAGVPYQINPRLVRGLDYYGGAVFEWVTGRLGAQGTICGGGRYDGLCAQIGGHPTPAAGFAIGLERLVGLLEEERGLLLPFAPHAALVLIGERAQRSGLAVAERLRDALPSLRLHGNPGGGGVKAQFRRADASGAALALILGDEELERDDIRVKALRGDAGQESLSFARTVARLKAQIATTDGAPAPQAHNDQWSAVDARQV